jgi:hypothetical protein
MNIDIVALDLLPETDPITVTDLADQGLQRCSWSCFFTCFGTCSVTEVAAN